MKSCQSISFREDLEEVIKSINEAYYRVEEHKLPSITHLITYLAFSVAAMYGAYYVTSLLWDKGYISTISIILIPIPIVLFRMALGPIFTYQKEKKEALRKRRELDDVLNIYGVQYAVTDVRVDKDMHGNKDYYLTLELSKSVGA